MPGTELSAGEIREGGVILPLWEVWKGKRIYSDNASMVPYRASAGNEAGQRREEDVMNSPRMLWQALPNKLQRWLYEFSCRGKTENRLCLLVTS